MVGELKRIVKKVKNDGADQECKMKLRPLICGGLVKMKTGESTNTSTLM